MSKNSLICIKRSWIYEHEWGVAEREVKGCSVRKGGTFSGIKQSSNMRKMLLSSLSALLKLLLALCMVLYLLKFISPSFLLLNPPTKIFHPKKESYFKRFAKVQPNIRALTIKKRKKDMIICLFSKVCTYIFLFKYIANIWILKKSREL